MSGLQLSVPGAAYTKYLDIADYPLQQAGDALSSLYYLGGSSAASVLNRAAGFAGAVAGANVTYQPNYAEFSGSQTDAANYIATADQNNASPSNTRIAVFQHLVPITGTGNRGIFGIFAGLAVGQSIMPDHSYMGNGSTLFNPGNSLVAPDAKFKFIAHTYDSGTGSFSTYYGLDGIVYLANTVNAGAGVAGAVQSERIGGANSAGTVVGASRIASVAKHRKVLTLAELQLAHDYLKGRLTKAGIAVY
ncbi:hypothetical protein BH10PSE18_BH10PSE18_50280 [soil metagenome]